MMKTVKSIDTLTKELAALDSAELHDLFTFYYRINHQHSNLTSPENFAKFLVSFDKNPFRRWEDKDFRKQMTDNLIAYTDDHMSLIILYAANVTLGAIRVDEIEQRIDELENTLSGGGQ